MFSQEVHQAALIRLMKRLREEKSQRDLSFLSDVSREYLRCLEHGTKKPSLMNVINIIEASGLDLKTALCDFVDMLNEEQAKITQSPAKAYVRKAKADSMKQCKEQEKDSKKLVQKTNRKKV